jgi:hypothetical protein
MSTNDTFLAVFLGGGKNSAKRAAWEALPEAERNARMQKGMAAWKGWVDKHQGSIVAMGGPLGKTKKADPQGIADTANLLTAFTVVRAPSHEAAAKMFENHPHFSIFPGEAVEIMPVLPIPGG